MLETLETLETHETGCAVPGSGAEVVTPVGRLADRHAGWIVSLAFWLLLLTAAALYALVTLSPKLLVWVQERNEYRANQARLVALERQVRFLERVGHALENEPAFAAELARIEFDAVRPGGERIAVAPHLTLAARTAGPARNTVAVLPWYAPLLRVFAANQRVRTRMLIAAAGLVLIAFTFLGEAARTRCGSWGRPASAWLRAIVGRYRAS